jgi:hypothetical protein
MSWGAVEARWPQCHGELVLSELVRATSGRCPGCGELLAPGYTFLLLEEARKVGLLQRELVMSLERLATLPGHLQLHPEAVLRATVEAVPWDERLANDRDVIRAESAGLRPQVSAWRSHSRREREHRTPELVAAIRRLAQRLRHHRERLEQRNAEVSDLEPRLDPGPVRQAADQMDAAAEAVGGHRRLADDTVLAALRTVDASIEPKSAEVPQPSSPK